jgi:hypothetical protein
VPEAVRVFTFASCAYSAGSSKDLFICPCIFKTITMAEIPQHSFPDRNKELVQQTDWNYLLTEKFNDHFILLSEEKNYNVSHAISYKASFITNIFHPPAGC